MPEFTFLLSPNLQTTKHTALAVTVSKIISGIEGCFLESKVLKDMSRLIQQGQSLIARDGSEIGCWKNRSKHIEFFEPVDDQSYYVWAPRKFSDYAHNLVVYSKLDFVELFGDCCRNSMKINPYRQNEFVLAMIVNGLSIEANYKSH